MSSSRGVPSATLAAPGIGIPVVVVSTRALGDTADGTRASVSVDATSRRGHTENVIAETPGGSEDHVVMAAVTSTRWPAGPASTTTAAAMQP